MREIRRILVANRGEIACRVIATIGRMGLEAVAVYSDADRHALHVRRADDARRIGPAPAAQSYLAIDRIIEAARESGADAIHPGYGFLSENADFAAACATAGLVFIGPSPASIRAMGSKSEAKALMEDAGVPLVPGYHGADQADTTLMEAARTVGYPVLIKAAAGGGGRGMRIVRESGALPEALASARREARAAFGNDRLLLERYLEGARHIEVQVFGDEHGNLVHLFERDCSVQRRYQKVIEEAPAPKLSGGLRARLHDDALRAARAVRYVNAGTVEFIVAGDDAFFMEMNTRLQVEHPVTEAITGLDLVEWQIRIARRETLPLAQEQIACRGHAIEARLYAEDPQRDFLPQSGRLERLGLPVLARGVRIDSGVTEGDTVSPYYDALIAKIVCHGASRTEALGTLESTLDMVRVAGLATNRRFLSAIVRHPAFAGGIADTGFLARHGPELMPPPAPPPDAHAALAALFLQERRHGRGRSPWDAADGWQANLLPAPWSVTLHDGLQRRTVTVSDAGAAGQLPQGGHNVRASVDGRPIDIACSFGPAADGYAMTVDGAAESGSVFEAAGKVFVLAPGRDTIFDIVDPRAAPAAFLAGGGRLVAPMPGTVAAVAVVAGDAVRAGVTLVVVEAMKMEHAVTAPHDGTVKRVDCRVGDLVREGEELVVLEAS